MRFAEMRAREGTVKVHRIFIEEIETIYRQTYKHFYANIVMSIYWLTSICCHPQSALATHIPATNRKTCLLHTRALIFACKYVQLQIRMQFPHLSHWLILIIKNLAEFIASSWHNTSTFTRANLRATTHQAYVPPHTAAVVHVFEYDYWIFISQLKALPAPPPVSAAALE